MKTTLLLAALAGFVTPPATLVIHACGAPLPAWITVGHLLAATVVPWLLLFIAHDYRPRRQPAGLPQPQPATPPAVAAPAARRARFPAFATKPTHATVQPL